VPKPKSSVLNMRDMDTVITGTLLGSSVLNVRNMDTEQCSKCEKCGHFDYHCLLESRHVNIVPSNNVDDSKIVEDIYIPSEISSVVEAPLVNPDAPIIDKSCAFCRY